MDSTRTNIRLIRLVQLAMLGLWAALSGSPACAQGGYHWHEYAAAAPVAAYPSYDHAHPAWGSARYADLGHAGHHQPPAGTHYPPESAAPAPAGGYGPAAAYYGSDCGGWQGPASYCPGGPAADEYCGPPLCATAPPALTVTVGGLFMTREADEHYRFSFDDADETDQRTDARDADIDWSGGFEIALTHRAPCSDCGWQFVYWGLFPDRASTATLGTDVAGNLNGILNWDQLNYNGATADTWVNNAVIHRLERDVEVHNAELNRLYFASDDCCGPLSVEWFAGARFFRLTDDLLFAADATDAMFTNAANELYYSIDTENNLIGGQVGGRADYRVSCRGRLFATGKAGVFGNVASADSRIGGAAGTATVNNGPNAGQLFAIDASKEDVATLAEVQLGGAWDFANCWSIVVGYRAVGATGLALPVDQIYHDLRGLQDVRELDTGGSLLLHGGFARLEGRF